MKYSSYPEDIKNARFYVEYIKHDNNDVIWRLFQRNFIEQQEVHPYQLADGKLMNNISINNKTYLEFIVDGMNLQCSMGSE